MNDNRADSFLRMIRRSQRGKLKIYLGYCAGVGKTYQMLQEARRLQADGIDVVVGFIETHGRCETQALVEGLSIIPRRQIIYHGIVTEEVDLDAILERHPAVVLVDELPHTNVPGSRNAKRYQDIEEILAAGIHVISAMNVQHLESLYETVERATGVKVRERVPDRLVTEADQLVNVDVTTEDLRQRLREGKVYTRERIETALENFFRDANLDQLRELTLRELAAQLDSRQRGASTEETLSAPDQVMVCLSSRGPNSEALLRYASRLAGRLNRNWYAVYVQTASENPTAIDAQTQRALSNTLALAQQLGATVFTYKGEDVVKTILQFAHEYRVGHIVVGSPGNRRPFWKRLLGVQGIIERLVIESKNVTVVVLDTRSVESTMLPVSKDATPALSVQTPHPLNSTLQHKTIADLWKKMPVIIWQEPVEKQMALRQLMESCLANDAALRKEMWQRLQEREKQGSTFIGEDVSLPHARIAGDTPLIALGISKEGIHDLDSNRTARIMILLLSPQASPEIHVQLLGEIGRLACDDQWRYQICASSTVNKVREIIK